jgi:hypothetical protein
MYKRPESISLNSHGGAIVGIKAVVIVHLRLASTYIAY